MSNNKLRNFKFSLAVLKDKISELNIQSGTSAVVVATLEFQQQTQQ